MATSRDKWVRRFVITETSCHKRGFTIYKVTSIVFMKASPERASKVSVWKRYNDFKKLHKSLNNIYKTLNMKESFPSFPKAKFFSRFESDVIKERRDSAIKLLEFIGRYQPLYTSDVFVKFFEISLQSHSSSDCNQSIGSDTSEESQVGSSSHGLLDNSLISQEKYEKLAQSVASFSNFSLLNSTTTNTDDDDSFRNISESPKFIQKKLQTDSSKLQCLSAPPQIFNSSSNIIESSEDYYGQYVLVAAAHISAGYRHESMNEHDEAFVQYKLGITNLSHGVRIDPDPIRQHKIYKKIEKYSQRAEILYNRYLKSNNIPALLLSKKSIDELQNYKVIKVMKSVMLVRDLRTNVHRVIKTIEKPSSENVNIHNYIIRGNAPFMIKLYGWVETETTIFIILQYVRAQELWPAIKKQYGLRKGDRLVIRKKNCMRSASCDATLQSKYKNYSLYQQYSDSKDINFRKIEITDKNKSSMGLEKDVKLIAQIFEATTTTTTTTTTGAIDNKDLPTVKLLEKAQLLLESVDATIRKSNSIADRLNKPKLYSSITTNDEEAFTATSTAISKIIEKNNNYENNREDSNGIEFMDNELWKIPESVVKQWTAQLIITLEFLHRQGIIIKNLMPENLLLGENDKIVMCYVIPKRTAQELNMQYKIPYAAPELCNFIISEKTNASEAADIWSFGVILYELLTGMNFETRHAESLRSHSIINIPNDLSDNAKSLLSSILIFEMSKRPTIEKIKQHPFYHQIEWEMLINS